MINYRPGIVGANDASTAFLKLNRSFPGLIYVFFRILFEKWDPFTDIITILIFALKERDGRIHFPILVKESGRGQPHPVGIVQSIVSI